MEGIVIDGGKIFSLPLALIVFAQRPSSMVTIGTIVGDAFQSSITIQVGSKTFCMQLMGIKVYIIMGYTSKISDALLSWDWISILVPNAGSTAFQQ